MRLLFLITITLGSGLLFLVQPLCARLVLPVLGGSPAVWTACMLFFQAGLLAGYAYSHFLPGWMGGDRTHAMVHALLLFLSLGLLPLTISQDTMPPTWPVAWLLGTLLTSVGPLFILLASNAPLLQRWFALQNRGKDPYFLYAASNMGSFAGLLAYPFFFEPAFTLPEQAAIWSWCYLVFPLLVVLCLLPSFLKSNQKEPEKSAAAPEESEPAPKAWQKARWVLLALAPSSLLLSVTSYLTSDIAPLPLFWVVPLGLYLLTFVLAFSKRSWLPQRQLVRWAPLGVVLVALLFQLEATDPLWVVFGLHLANFVLLAALCHGELARTRPSVQYLTGFFFWLALGGVLGGLFNGVIAPLLFPSNLEYPLMLVAVMFLLPRKHDLDAAIVPPPWRTIYLRDLTWPLAIGLITLGLVFLGRALGMGPGPLSVGLFLAPGLLISYFLQDRPVRFALTLGAVLLASVAQPGIQGDVVFRGRSFFGVHLVTEKEGKLFLTHGNTVHGSQYLDPSLRRLPQNYYTREGPAGLFLSKLPPADPRLQKVGVIGLGTGSMASYAEAGQTWTFFEIDPMVVHIARDAHLFTYLGDATERGANLQIELGDARLSLRASQETFGLLILDAFSSDAIPVHLLTKEAFLEYRRHVRDDGFLLLHISNRYLDLAPILANLAEDLDWTCLVRESKDSTWALLTWQDTDHLRKYVSAFWFSPEPNPAVGVWRDTYANLLPLIDWSGQEREFRPFLPQKGKTLPTPP